MDSGLRFLSSAAFVIMLAACALPTESTMTSSTQGSTLVRFGHVTNIGTEPPGADNRATALTVQFENGDVRTYTAAAGETFQIGDTVKVTRHQGITQVTH